MYYLWQKKLELNYPKSVLDIVQFGSSLQKENPNDIDLAVIFEKIPLKDQLAIGQAIKEQIEKKTNIPIHLKVYDLYSFFNEGNFAKESILFYGISIITKKYFSENFGMIPLIEINYSFEDKKKKDKVRFNYMLSGKKGKYGLLREYKGKLIKPGIIAIKPEHQQIFIDAIKKEKVNYAIKKIFAVKNE
jgi:hypothetical protein